MNSKAAVFLGICIVVAAFAYAWMNRYEYQLLYDGMATQRIDKWTGETCRQVVSNKWDC